MTGHLSNDDFFVQLSQLFESRQTKGHGSIFLTQKPFIYDTATSTASSPNPTDPLADLNAATPLPLLIRATNGSSKEHRQKRIKLSTVVEADALEGFYGRYAELWKVGMQGLKKRDRSGRKKAKAKKKKATTTQ
ncbi:MAG: hypothetical protein M1817_006795 [Caeruleum heppii]|nr:MAG: hypothetical protein M1817_006795 [Caeruleum heppii]